MPELPEVETTCHGIAPYINSTVVQQVIVRQPRLRWVIPETITSLIGQSIQKVERRAKYILVKTDNGTLIIHLGMSGSLRICTVSTPLRKHDHVDFVLSNGNILRFHDPRRFGAVLWVTGNVLEHPLLAHLGPEPLSDAFDVDYFCRQTQSRKTAIKPLLMDARIVVGLGNIYANEALFLAQINPSRAAGSLTLGEHEHIVRSIKQVLSHAITQGGTTLRDFVKEDGTTGYFQLELRVYGRTKQPCTQCQTAIVQIKQGQRSTWYCPVCQI